MRLVIDRVIVWFKSEILQSQRFLIGFATLISAISIAKLVIDLLSLPVSTIFSAIYSLYASIFHPPIEFAASFIGVEISDFFLNIFTIYILFGVCVRLFALDEFDYTNYGWQQLSSGWRRLLVHAERTVIFVSGTIAWPWIAYRYLREPYLVRYHRGIGSGSIGLQASHPKVKITNITQEQVGWYSAKDDCGHVDIYVISNFYRHVLVYLAKTAAGLLILLSINYIYI